MDNLPKKADATARLFDEDNEWLKKQAKKRHTIVAVIIHELVAKEKENDELK